MQKSQIQFLEGKINTVCRFANVQKISKKA